MNNLNYQKKLLLLLDNELNTIIDDPSSPYHDLPKSGIMRTNAHEWYNIKKTQFISGLAYAYLLTNNKKYLDSVKKILLKSLTFQRDDGYYYTDAYDAKIDKARANVAFINIEFLNAYEIIKEEFSKEEQHTIKEKILLSAKYIVHNIRFTAEVNQAIAAALFLEQCAQNWNRYNLEANKYFAVVKEFQTSEGGWLEKGEAFGYDALYGSLMLVYLFRYFQLTKNNDAKDMIIRGVNFIGNFVRDNGELDLSYSKRWLPQTPLGKCGLALPLCQCNVRYSQQYLSNAIKVAIGSDCYYLFKSIYDKTPIVLEKLNEERKEFYGIYQYESSNIIANFLTGTGRISGGAIGSIYLKNKGWIVQQSAIEKNDLPLNATQIQVELDDGKILSSVVDSRCFFDKNTLTAIGVLRELNSTFNTNPYAYYEVEKATTDIWYKRIYKITINHIDVSESILFGKEIRVKKITSIVPLLRGSILSKDEITKNTIAGIYGPTNIHYINYKFSKIEAGTILHKSFKIMFN